MLSLHRKRWLLALAGAILYFAATPAFADCLCADLVQAFAICTGDGCANINFTACSTSSFTGCSVCVGSRKFAGCCDGGEFFQIMKAGGPCLVAGLIQKKRNSFLAWNAA